MTAGRCSAVAAVLAAVLAAACVPPEPEAFPRHHEPDTYMGRLQASGRIRIAVPEDAPPIGYAGRSGRAEGFAVGLGRIVARALHVRPEFEAYPAHRLQGLVDVGGADLSFPLAPITERLLREHSLTDPYLVSHQRLLVPAGSGWTDVDDLAGSRVCAFLDEVTGVELDRLEPRLEVRSADDLDSCRRAFARGRVDVVTAQDFLLAHVEERLEEARARRAAIVGEGLNTVGYAASVVTRPGFPRFVRDVLEAAKADGRWTRAYRRWIDLPAKGPPALTLEEAAALWPLEAETS